MAVPKLQSNFLPKKPSLIRFAVVFVILAAVSFGGYKFFQKKSAKNTSAVVPTAYASDIPGWWIQQYFGTGVCHDVVCKSDADPDSDGLTNAQEYLYKSDPLNYRTAGEKLNDGEMVAQGFDPSKPGKVTFDDAASPDNIMGESLVFDQDIKKMIGDAQDVNKVQIPLVDDKDLKISEEQTEAVYKKYFSDYRATVARYFSPGEVAQTTQILQSNNSVNPEDIVLISEKATSLSQALKNLTVPQVLVNYHKYNIAFYSLLADVIQTQKVDSDAWYDQAQAFLAVQQKLSNEITILSKQFKQ